MIRIQINFENNNYRKILSDEELNMTVKKFIAYLLRQYQQEDEISADQYELRDHSGSLLFGNSRVRTEVFDQDVLHLGKSNEYQQLDQNSEEEDLGQDDPLQQQNLQNQVTLKIKETFANQYKKTKAILSENYKWVIGIANIAVETGRLYTQWKNGQITKQSFQKAFRANLVPNISACIGAIGGAAGLGYIVAVTYGAQIGLVLGPSGAVVGGILGGLLGLILGGIIGFAGGRVYNATIGQSMEELEFSDCGTPKDLYEESLKILELTEQTLHLLESKKKSLLKTVHPDRFIGATTDLKDAMREKFISYSVAYELIKGYNQGN